jgi:hypothetical protein
MIQSIVKKSIRLPHATSTAVQRRIQRLRDRLSHGKTRGIQRQNNRG